MPPLKNPKHEKFAQNLVKAPSQTQAYKDTYHVESSDVARANASRLLANDNVKDRFYELLRGSGIDLAHISSRFGHWLNNDLAPVQSWDAVKTGLKIYGILDDDSSNQKNNAISVSINIV